MAYDDAMNYDGLESWDEPSSIVSPKWPNIGQSASRLGSNASSQDLMGMFRNLQDFRGEEEMGGLGGLGLGGLLQYLQRGQSGTLGGY